MNSKQEAEAAVATEVAAPETQPAPAPKKKRQAKPDLTLADLAERYIKHLEDEGKSPGTCSSYTAELRLAIKELGAETKITGITSEQVGAFFSSKAVTKLRSGRAKAKPSVDKTRRVLRLALVWAAEKKLIKSAPIPEQN
jgi:RNA 3'-terminal phosphate cyclase